MLCALLLHDIGDTLAVTNHADLAATILQPFVSEENLWMVKHHAIFQGYYFFHHLGHDRNLRDNFIDNPYYKRTADFVANYDEPAFDPNQTTFSLDFFEPMVQQLFKTPKHVTVPFRESEQ